MAVDGTLRPQSYEGSVPCASCHGGIGATTDSTFSFARKLGPPAPARAWYHWSQHPLRGLPDPGGVYARYLRASRAADDFADNEEAQRQFFDAAGAPRPAAFARLRADVAPLVWPTPARALALDRATWAIVREQSFTLGRDPVLPPGAHAHRNVPAGAPTG